MTSTASPTNHALIALLASTLGACMIVDDTLIEQLPSREGDAGVDAGTGDPLPADECGDPDTFVLPRVAAQQLEVDTRPLQNRVRAVNCSDVDGAARGHDGFYAIDVEELDYWHFHLTPLDDGEARNPVLYLLEARDGVCNTQRCRLSNRCVRFGGEHFGFRPGPDDAGRWYLGIDDAEDGGGRYVIEVFKPNCGDGDAEHGEGCDGDAECDPACRRRLTGDQVDEAFASVPPNTPDEALAVSLAPGATVVVAGNADNDQDAASGDECSYPDYYTFSVPENGSLSVVEVDPSGAPCDSVGDVVPLELTLLSRSLVVEATSRPEPGTQCPRLDVDGLREGQYFLTVEQAEERERSELEYRLRVSVEEP